ncbi:MAG: hypothetical protein CSB49_06390 [Proteobacteria bacterium]|nr:MAG: hypothetical protein CSB49_06390 [Pseudomonadota bacterium]
MDREQADRDRDPLEAPDGLACPADTRLHVALRRGVGDPPSHTQKQRRDLEAARRAAKLEEATEGGLGRRHDGQRRSGVALEPPRERVAELLALPRGDDQPVDQNPPGGQRDDRCALVREPLAALWKREPREREGGGELGLGREKEGAIEGPLERGQLAQARALEAPQRTIEIIAE